MRLLWVVSWNLGVSAMWTSSWPTLRTSGAA